MLEKANGAKMQSLVASTMAKLVLTSVLHLVKDNLSKSDAMKNIETIVKNNKKTLSKVTLTGWQKYIWRFYFSFPRLYCAILNLYYFSRDKMHLRINVK